MNKDDFVSKEFRPIAGISKSPEHQIDIDSDGMVVMTTLSCETGESVKVVLAVDFNDLRDLLGGIQKLVVDAMEANPLEIQSAVTKH